MKNYVLIADDDADDIYLMQKALRETDFPLPAQFVTDGYQAVKHLEACTDFFPSLVLLDVNMPKIGGLEVLKFIKASCSLAAIKVIMLSTSSANVHKAHFIGNGAGEFITKPDTYGEMINVFNSLKDLLPVSV